MTAALLLVDVINGFDFEDSGPLTRAAEEVAPHIRALTVRAREAGVPVIYVNDNFGMWQSDFRALTERCLDQKSPGHQVTRSLLPEPGDHFVLKPRHSGFLATPLELLLAHLKIGVLVVCGFAADLCVLFTAVDAHARGFHVVVPHDCTAANSPRARDLTLELLRESLRASICAGDEVDFSELADKERRSLFHQESS